MFSNNSNFYTFLFDMGISNLKKKYKESLTVTLNKYENSRIATS